MHRLIERCAMLDVHKAQITACVRVPDGCDGRHQETREFRTTSAGLVTLAGWLRSYRVTVVGMESTGVYWRAIYYMLEDEFECQLFNARHLRHVPGCKSDVSVLAYAGVRPQEALALRWRNVRERTLLVEEAVAYGKLKGQ